MISIPTRYIYKILRNHLHIKPLQEAANLYQVFMCNSYTKAPAGHIFEDVHNLFCKGGEWRITPLTKNKAGPLNTHFKSPSRDAKSSYAHLGYHGDPVKVAHQSLSETTTFVPLVHHHYLIGQSIPTYTNLLLVSRLLIVSFMMTLAKPLPYSK